MFCKLGNLFDQTESNVLFSVTINAFKRWPSILLVDFFHDLNLTDPEVPCVLV